MFYVGEFVKVNDFAFLRLLEEKPILAKFSKDDLDGLIGVIMGFENGTDCDKAIIMFAREFYDPEAKPFVGEPIFLSFLGTFSASTHDLIKGRLFYGKFEEEHTYA